MAILFTNVTAVTMDPARPELKNAFVAVEGTKIASVGTVRPAGEFERVIDCTGKVLMPGFVNAHTHVPMTLMRGYGGGCDLHTWLNKYIFPAEAKLDERCVAAGAALGLAEMIASGTTCIADMYMNTETIAQAVLEAGISANLACGAVYFGAPEDFSPDKCNDCQNHIRLFENWHGAGDGQILVDASIHAEYTSCPPAWEWVADFAQKHNLRMHVHVSETHSEHEKCIEKYGATPAQLLDKYGVWQNGGIAAHCVYLSGGDAELFAKRGVTAVHNPVSNLKLMSGVAPLFFLRDCGMSVALGTDVAGGDTLSMLDAASSAIRASKARRILDGWETDFLTAAEAWYLATSAGAAFFGEGPGFAPGNALHALVLDDSRLLQPHPLTPEERLERCLYVRQPGAVRGVWSAGRRVFSPED